MARVLALLLGVTIVAAFITLIFHLILTDLEDSTTSASSPAQNTYIAPSPPVNNVKVIVPNGDTSKYKVY